LVLGQLPVLVDPAVHVVRNNLVENVHVLARRLVEREFVARRLVEEGSHAVLGVGFDQLDGGEVLVGLGIVVGLADPEGAAADPVVG
jgi:hypothetical protein